MPYLTHDEILLTYPFGAPYRFMVYHDPTKWKHILNHNLGSPIKLKFDEHIRDNMPENIRKGKGIYMFFVEPNHPLHQDVFIKHLLYVGRVQSGGSDHNFYKRFFKYLKAIGNRNSALNIMRLTNCWPDNTFVYYFDLSARTDDEIINIEKNIFNNIIPPLNEELHGEARLTRKFY